jgi:RsiW-degrading membrane proteinase PrsW (M82 family)
VSILFQDDRLDPRKRLEKTLEAHKELKPKVEELMHSETATVDDLLKILPGRRLDGLAHLPRDSQQHWVYAGASAGAFFVLVGVWMAWRVAPAWQLVLVALFTASFGIAILLLMQDLLGHGYQLLLTGDKTFLVNMIGFLVVGLTEELSKALPVIFYLRTFKSANWRGACLWGMASGVGFGIAEGVLYAREMYNGVAPASVYLIRFASCVTLHAVWSASVGITLFGSRRLLGRIIGVFVYGDKATFAEAWVPVLRVLGVAMVLHGLYDTLLTQEQFLPALVVAVLSFAWLGWQIEESREETHRQAKLRAELGMA